MSYYHQIESLRWIEQWMVFRLPLKYPRDERIDFLEALWK